MNNKEIAQIVEPFEEGFAEVFHLAWVNVLSTVPHLGIPTKVERANCMHRALRNIMRPICENFSPILEFIEEPDGQGKDYIIIDSGESEPLALCWGRYGNGVIRRSSTIRNQHIQGQGYLFPVEDGVGMPQVTATLGYDVADDFTECGKPCWWMQRLVLLRERQIESEFIKDIYCYEKPEAKEIVVEDYISRIRKKESRQIEKITDIIRKKIA
ncbi:MAG: hypothetical protein A2Y12_01295 [Planctomycetes bacterium GWF2_42_9]|nr:MAG: hypothetical protein A2Y12_01295 [Planctomycetes bacterium GWF2_42_9]